MIEEEEKLELKQDTTNTKEPRKSVEKLPAATGNSIWAATGLEKIKTRKTPKIHKR